VSQAVQFYLTTVLVFLCVDVMACLGLNIQFGLAGLYNFAYIVFVAAGGYTAAILTLGPSSQLGGFQSYIGGAHLPFPLPIIIAGFVGAALSLAVGALTLRRLRSDYQAMVMLLVSLIATDVATSQTRLVNGPTGLSLIPKPLASLAHLSLVGYQWLYVGIAVVITVIVFLYVQSLARSPVGRVLRALRENEFAAAALGKNTLLLRLFAFTVGGFIAGVAGAVLVEFVGAWAPASWLYPETFVLFTALVIGGVGNNYGAALGALLVPIAFSEVTRFLPQVVRPGFIDSVQWLCIGGLLLLFLWFWPRGIIPERPGRPTSPPVSPGRPSGLLQVALTQRPPGTAPVSTEPVLRTTALRKEFDRHTVVDGVSFEVAPGSITALIGPNGAGKSTVLGMIAGATKPTGGQVHFRGADITGLPAHRVARRGLVRTFQLGGEFARLTVLENMLVALRDHPGELLLSGPLARWRWRSAEHGAVDRARALLDRFQLLDKENVYASDLSGGQRRLLELARALMTSPTLLLLDEPMAGVNPALAHHLAGYLEELRAGGLSMLLVEHEMAFVEECCDKVIVLAQGQLICTGTMAEVRRDKGVMEAYLVG
jgi:branched-chain amino acid transport system permease protein